MVIGFVFTKLLDASFWSYLTRSNDVFEALITFGLIWTTYVFLFCTDRLVCPNKSVNKRQFTSGLVSTQRTKKKKMITM